MGLAVESKGFSKMAWREYQDIKINKIDIHVIVLIILFFATAL